MDRTHTTRRIGIVGLLLAAAALALLLAPQQRHITELEATSPEVTAAQHAFIASEKSAQAAEKELEEVENDVSFILRLPPRSRSRPTIRFLFPTALRCSGKLPRFDRPHARAAGAGLDVAAASFHAQRHCATAHTQDTAPIRSTETRHDSGTCSTRRSSFHCISRTVCFTTSQVSTSKAHFQKQRPWFEYRDET